MKGKFENSIFKAGMCVTRECLYLSWIGSIDWLQL